MNFLPLIKMDGLFLSAFDICFHIFSTDLERVSKFFCRSLSASGIKIKVLSVSFRDSQSSSSRLDKRMQILSASCVVLGVLELMLIRGCRFYLVSY